MALIVRPAESSPKRQYPPPLLCLCLGPSGTSGLWCCGGTGTDSMRVATAIDVYPMSVGCRACGSTGVVEPPASAIAASGAIGVAVGDCGGVATR